MDSSGIPMNVTLRQLQAFVAVSQTGSFTLAAERLFITQSALSGLIKELYAELSRFYGLDPARWGNRANYAALNIVPTTVSAQVASATTSSSAPIARTSANHCPACCRMACTLLPEAMAGFRAQYPGVQMRLVDCAVESVVARVFSGEVDIGLGPEREADGGVTIQFGGCDAGEHRLRRSALAVDQAVLDAFGITPAPKPNLARWEDVMDRLLNAEGEVRVDGRPLTAYDPASLHEQVGVIFQDFVRYHLTAAENIGVGQIEGIVRLDREHLAGGAVDRVFQQGVLDRALDGVDGRMLDVGAADAHAHHAHAGGRSGRQQVDVPAALVGHRAAAGRVTGLGNDAVAVALPRRAAGARPARGSPRPPSRPRRPWAGAASARSSGGSARRRR